MHLVEDEQLDEIDQLRVLFHFSREDVQFLWCHDQHLGPLDLFPGQLHIAGELLHGEADRFAESLREVLGHLTGQRLHRSDVDDLEVVLVDLAELVGVLLDLVDHREHRNSGLTGSGRSGHQQILVGLRGRLVDHRLNLIERLEAGEDLLRHLVQLLDRDQGEVLEQLLLRTFGRRHGDLLERLQVVHLGAFRKQQLLIRDER